MPDFSEIRIRNFRSLRDVTVKLGPINVLFGPNGSGKSSFLDAIWFVRDCAIRGVELASAQRSHGIGVLFDGAEDREPISINITSTMAEYDLSFGLSSGRIEPFVGEQLRATCDKTILINRKMGTDKAEFHKLNSGLQVTLTLREPQKLSLDRYLAIVAFEQPTPEAEEMDRLLRYVHFYNSRSFNLFSVKQKGSEVSHETCVWERGDNIWSVLRNLHDRKERDDRYNTIIGFMKECFPTFDGLLLEQTGPTTVYGNFLEKGRRKPIMASGASDGHLQMLLLLTSLFSEGPERYSMMIFDEPEISLHPLPISVFAKAVKLAADKWNKLIFIATHSPVLVDQFEPNDLLAVKTENGETRLQRVSEMEDKSDLIREYSVGSLYMAQAIAPQTPVVEAEQP